MPFLCSLFLSQFCDSVLCYCALGVLVSCSDCVLLVLKILLVFISKSALTAISSEMQCQQCKES